MTAFNRKHTGCSVRLINLSKEYESHVVLDDVSLSVREAEIFGLLGPNGAGKSTLMKIIAGLTRPDRGRVEIFGAAAGNRSAVLKRLVGLVPQDNNMERDLTVEEVLRIYARLFGVDRIAQRVEAALAEFSLGEYRTKRIGHLSGGLARRALIARALLPEPRLLLLDEPTVGLDPDVRRELWDIVRRLAAAGKTIVITTHYMEEAEQLCHRVAMLKAGRLALLDTPQGIKTRFGQCDGTATALETAFIKLAREGKG